MNKTSASSDTSPNREPGATDSLWQPSWWQWLISALSGTVEIEKQTAWLKKSNEELRNSNEEARKQHEQRMSEQLKTDAELKKQHEQRMSELRKENERLAELESKLDAVLPKSVSN
jgi:DNA repair exonuclease SbcCD ATPase subunit